MIEKLRGKNDTIILQKPDLLVEEIQIDLLSRAGDCIRSYALDDILEDYHIIGTTFHYKTSSSSGIIDLEHFGLL